MHGQPHIRFIYAFLYKELPGDNLGETETCCTFDVLHVILYIILMFNEFTGIISECIWSGMAETVATELFATPICTPQARIAKPSNWVVERQLRVRRIEIKFSLLTVQGKTTSGCGERTLLASRYARYLWMQWLSSRTDLLACGFSSFVTGGNVE